MLGTRFTWLKSISSGPYAILFSIIYQYKTLVPPSYQVKMLGTSLSDKTYVYFAATQLFLSNHNSSIIPCLCGLAIGAVYDNSNILKRWRFPRWLRRLTSKYIVPVLGTNKPSSGTSLNNVSNSVRPLSASTATTMPNVQSSSLARSPTAPRSSRSLKEEDINTMFAMFPNYSREDIKNALIQSNSNLNRAAEILLTTEPSAGSSNNNNSSQ
ncbi:hypothetical protein BDF20DRAFT_845231 [Mycotypha africana]|uniref:uncharacterized protein n=1 Tax=Mycotypha africana TaxID=64632 RepID=UPI0023000FAB|nr:uncharacterized protein BDF20DRAFT_845231 [Mycotypha africana]KAI8991544.1 hypothetical protein BDF20DRAFT_845231 [Mycotypha africana]